MMKLTTILGLMAGSAIAQQQQQERAHVIVMKDFSSFELGDGVEFNVTYKVSNVGEADATDIVITDEFPDSTFEVVSGSLEANIAELGSGETAEHTVTLKPVVGGGVISIPPAEVEYAWNEIDAETGDSEVMTVSTKSSAIGNIQILTAEQYAARNSQHVTEWSVFSSFSGLAIFFPFVLWKSKSSKFHSSGRIKQAY